MLLMFGNSLCRYTNSYHSFLLFHYNFLLHQSWNSCDLSKRVYCPLVANFLLPKSVQRPENHINAYNFTRNNFLPSRQLHIQS